MRPWVLRQMILLAPSSANGELFPCRFGVLQAPPSHPPARGLAGGWVRLGNGCTHADGWVSGVKLWEEAGALYQIPSLTRSDGAERLSDREGGRQDGSDGGAGGGERETGL